MANKDLEFTLKFKNEAKQVIAQARNDLKGLGTTAKEVAAQLKSISSANGGNGLAGNLNSSTLAAQKLQIAQAKLDLEQQRLSISSQKLTQAQAAIGIGEQRLAQQTERLALSQQRLDQQKGRLAQSTKNLTGAFGGLVGQFIPFTVAAAAFKGIEMADEFVLLQARIKNSTETTQEFQQAFKGLQDIARNTGAGLEPVVSIFQRLAFTRKEIKATTDEMLQFTDTVSKLGVISGASPDALKFGLTQLGQSLSSNIVRAEEFNSIMENIPAVGKTIADQLGVTTGQLRLLVVNGKLLSEDVFAALLNATEDVNAQFDKFPQTVGRAFSGLLQDVQNGIGGFNEATGASQGLIKVLYAVGKILKGTFQFLGAFGAELGLIFKGIVATIVTVANTGLGIVEKSVNLVIAALNKIRKDKIEPIDISINTEDLNAGIDESFRTSLESVNKQFNESMGSFADAVGLGDEDVKKAETNGRKISTDYKKIAEGLSAGKKTKGQQKQENFLRDYELEIQKLQEETKYVGESEKARARRVAILKVEQDAIKAGIKNFDPSDYVRAYDALVTAQEKVHTDFNTGLRAAIQDFQENAKGMGDLAQDVFKSASDGISNTLAGLVDGSTRKLSDLRKAVGSILGDIASQIAKFLVTQQIINPILNSFGFFGGASAATPIPGGIGGTNYLLNAKGNAWSAGHKVNMFAKGGILDGPTIFPSKNGMNVGGEAGTESVMPLKRMSNGDLGIQADMTGGGSGGIIYQPRFSIHIDAGGNSQMSQDSGAQSVELAKRIDDEVGKKVIEVIKREQRPGGLLGGGKVQSA